MGKKITDSNIDFSEYIRLYLSKWKLIIISLLITCSIGIGIIIFYKPIYKINANIMLRNDDGILSAGSMAKDALLKSFGSSFGMGGGSSNLDDEIAIMTSHTLLTKTVDLLNLEIVYTDDKIFDKTVYYKNSPIRITPLNPFLTDTLTKSLKVIVDVDKNGQVKAKAKTGFFSYKTIGQAKGTHFPLILETSLGDFKISTTPFFEKDKDFVIKAYIKGKEYAAENLLKEIIVEPAEKNGNLIVFGTKQNDKNKGKDILNTIIALYDTSAMNDKKDLMNHTISFVQERLDQVAQELSVAEKEIEFYKKANKLSDLETEAKITLEKNGDFMEKLVDIETQLNVINMISDYIDREENRYMQIPNGLGIDDKGLAEAIQLYNEVIIERARLLRNSSPNNPVLININEQVNLMRENVIASINNVKASIAIAQKDLKKQENAFMDRIKNMPTQEREYINIKRDQLIKEQVYLFLYEKREENTLMLALTRPKAKIVDVPYVLSKPDFPKAKNILSLAFALGLLLPALYVIYLDMFGKNIRSEAMLKAITSLPVIAIKNSVLKKCLSYDKLTDNIKEYCNLIALRIYKRLKVEDIHSIAITSFDDHKASSVLASVLATNWTLSDKRCIIVDLNFKLPFLSDCLGVDGSDELVEYLMAGKLEPSDLIKTDKQNKQLDYIVINQNTKVSSECLLSNKMKTLMAYLNDKYDYIVFCMPPLGKRKTLLSLYQNFDSVLFICEENNILKQDIVEIENETNDQLLRNTFIVFGTYA